MQKATSFHTLRLFYCQFGNEIWETNNKMKKKTVLSELICGTAMVEGVCHAQKNNSEEPFNEIRSHGVPSNQRFTAIAIKGWQSADQEALRYVQTKYKLQLYNYYQSTHPDTEPHTHNYTIGKSIGSVSRLSCKTEGSSKRLNTTPAQAEQQRHGHTHAHTLSLVPDVPWQSGWEGQGWETYGHNITMLDLESVCVSLCNCINSPS